MSDPKDELGDRFEQHSDSDGPASSDSSGDTDHQGNTDDTNNSDNPNNTRREKTQVPMYLPAGKKEEWNSLYNRLDARSKLNDNGGIEKNADFAEAVVDFVVEHEADLAEKLDIATDR